MILGFKQYFPWKEPTYFREKILCGAGHAVVEENGIFRVVKPKEYVLKAIKQFSGIHPKIHTIREDKHDRWKAGRSIQMVYRGPKYSILSHFNKGIPELDKCRSTQKFEIIFSVYASDMRMCSIFIKEELYWTGQVIKSGANSCAPEERKLIETLAINDGFKDSKEFFRWFSKDFSDKLIAWTDFKY